MDEQRLVEVYRAKNGVEAHLLKSKLEREGIRAVVDGDMLQGGLGELALGWTTAPRILVGVADEAKVRAIVERFEDSQRSAIELSEERESSVETPAEVDASQSELNGGSSQGSIACDDPLGTSTRDTPMLLGLRTVIYHVDDIENATEWYTQLLGFAPYFNEPFYVGFNVGGFELGLHPDVTSAKKCESSIAYWGVANAKEAYTRLLSLGAKAHEEIQDVGGGILVGTVIDPWGNTFGVIENPHFKIAPST